MKTNPNDNAFPEFIKGDVQESGLTKREWFAGMAMNGFISCLTANASTENIAIGSVAMANALIEELNKT